MSSRLTAHPVRGDQATIGLALAAALVASWLGCHLYGVFVHRWTALGIVAAPALILLQCWLNVGLFIVAHDCMHGSLAPGLPRLNGAIGRICLALYAGFSYGSLRAKHVAHHRFSGTEHDPDFHPGAPRRFWPWYLAFFRRYFGWKEFGILTAILATYLVALRASPVNALLLWGVPAILSSLQLFFFGTYLPHRHEDAPFADRHNARSTELSRLASLVTCFHFGGFHHEHHDDPGTPWWKLPRARRRDAAQPGRA